MKATDIRDLVHFADDSARRSTLFESKHLWSEVICLEGSQSVGPMADEGSDAIVTVLAGEVAAQVDSRRVRMRQWEALLVPAGGELTIKNASPEPTVVLLVLSPPPPSGAMVA
jgi:quercetin dioxygenase-like cupin family protein